MGESFVPMMAGVYELVARSIVAFTLPKYMDLQEYAYQIQLHG